MEDFYARKLKNEKRNNRKKLIEEEREELTRLLKEKLADPDKAANEKLQKLKIVITDFHPNQVSVNLLLFCGF